MLKTGKSLGRGKRKERKWINSAKQRQRKVGEIRSDCGGEREAMKETEFVREMTEQRDLLLLYSQGSLCLHSLGVVFLNSPIRNLK